jgi:S1-C subfamily serine protease
MSMRRATTAKLSRSRKKFMSDGRRVSSRPLRLTHREPEARGISVTKEERVGELTGPDSGGASGDAAQTPTPTPWGETLAAASGAPTWPTEGPARASEAPESDGFTAPVWPTVANRYSGDRATPIASDARGSSRSWFSVALVAAIVGALIGAGVVWVAKGSNGPTTFTIKQGGREPGAEILTAGQSIPSLVREVSPSVVSVNVTSAFAEDQGTGMILSKNGLVLTNNHVVAAAENGQGTITVTRTGTSTTLPVTLLGYSVHNDVALLQIHGVSNLPAVTFGNSTELVVGDAVVAIGNALGLAAGTPTVTQGIVSALGRTVTASNSVSNRTETLHNMIQTDAAINPGNSGGPLIDSNGQVIGMNTAVAGTTDDGTNAQNIGFAIPSGRIEQLLPALLRAKVTKVATKSGAYLGVFIESDSSTVAAEYGLTVTSGAYVSQTVAGYPAAVGGIEAGDVIVSIDHSAIASGANVETVMRTLRPGMTVPIGVVRGSKRLTLEVTVTAPPPGL